LDVATAKVALTVTAAVDAVASRQRTHWLAIAAAAGFTRRRRRRSTAHTGTGKSQLPRRRFSSSFFAGWQSSLPSAAPNAVTLWRPDTGQKINVVEDTGRVDGPGLLAGTGRRWPWSTIRANPLRDWAADRASGSRSPSRPVNCVAFSPTAAPSPPRCGPQLQLWDLATHQPLGTYGSEGEVWASLSRSTAMAWPAPAKRTG